MKTLLTGSLLVTALVCACGAIAAPSYTIIPLGLTGAEHTHTNGYKVSFADYLNEAGQVAGYSERYNGNSHLGYSAWLYDGTTTLDVGLTDAEHTRNDGYKSSFANYLNEAGQVAGYSYRFNDNSDWGYSAWLYDGTTTIGVGLTGTEHTRTDGYKSSFANYLNEAGQVAGYSYRFNDNSDWGYSAWLYDGTMTIGVGLTGAEHTHTNGYKVSYASYLNEAGQVAGYSQRYTGSSDWGYSAWLYDGTTAIDVGLTGIEHTHTNGYKYSIATYLNEAGQVAGTSQRYTGSSSMGASAWLYDGTTAIDVGLTGAEHTRNDGYKYSVANYLNEVGQVAGYSYRFNGSNFMGYSAWLYNGTTTVDVGLTGTEHTRNDGYKSSSANQLNEAGQVAGRSERYTGSNFMGYSAWLYDGTSTLDIGLTGTEHTRNDGHKYSIPTYLNEVGQVAGYSFRFNGNSNVGQDAWLYDPVLDQTFSLQLSSQSNGYASSSVAYLGNDGLVLGYYELFDALDNYLGYRAFSFTVDDGLHDLGLLVDGGLAANGWEHLALAVRGNSLGQIIGYGRLADGTGSQMAYLLTPVPEPSTLVLLALGGVGLALWRRGR